MPEPIVIQSSADEILYLAIAAFGAVGAAAISAWQTIITRRNAKSEYENSRKAMQLQINLQVMERYLNTIHELIPLLTQLSPTVKTLIARNSKANFSDIPVSFQPAVARLTAVFEEIGMYLFYGEANEDQIITMIGDSAISAWSILEPIMKNERAATVDTVWIFFEYLVMKVKQKSVKQRLEEAGFYKELK